MNRKLSIAVLSGDNDTLPPLYNALAKSFEVKAVIVEKPPSIIGTIKRRVKRVGLFAVADQILFHIAGIFMKRLYSKRVKDIWNRYGLEREKPHREIMYRVDSVNSDACISILKSSGVDTVVLNGTRIVGVRTLTAIPVPFLNIHAGITPAYRGVHGAYRALVAGDRSHCGVTVHLVDKGIDTGAVIYQKTIETTDSDSFFTYPYIQFAEGLSLLIDALSDISRNRLRTYFPEFPSQLWYHPGLTEYIRNYLSTGVK